MRTLSLYLAACAMIAAASPAAGQQSASTSATSRQLFRLEDQWAAALVKRDADFFRLPSHASDAKRARDRILHVARPAGDAVLVAVEAIGAREKRPLIDRLKK